MNWVTVVLILATVSTGLGAGAFALYAHTIMPGLGRTDDATFVTAFRAIDRAVLNPWFIAGSFFGSLVLTAVAAVGTANDPARPWVIVAGLGSLATVIITLTVNVPLNNAIKAVSDADVAREPRSVRSAFSETRWRAWNHVRTITSVAAFGCLTWALVLHGATL